MPNYEYRCLNCKRRFEVYLSYNEYGKQSLRCPHCNSEQVQRRIGRIRFARSEESRLESLADPSSLAGLEDDPKAMARMMRQMSSETGEDLGPEFDEVMDRLESGQSPDEIEEAMPDMETGGAGMGGEDFE
ncbi:MAG TPA: FmdB family zinc ribbon protein [Anaerolineales bacterium]|nr:FmdB family zinc ribbon protein [Anaerolineales bacterium]